MNNFRGFTLIELMIVVAIIAILAAVALPAYQNYVARSQVTAGVAEIAPGRTAFETLFLNQGDFEFDTAELGLQADTARCDVVTVPGAEGSIECTLKGNPVIAGGRVRFERSEAGIWTCVTEDIQPQHVAQGCTPL